MQVFKTQSMTWAAGVLLMLATGCDRSEEVAVPNHSSLRLAAASGSCRDPWINSAYQEVHKRAPVGTTDVGECYTKLYNNGSWSNYNELKTYIRELRSNGTRVGYAPANNGNYGMALNGNGQTTINLLKPDGTVIAIGAAKIVAAGGGNLIGMGGNTLIGTDGATFRINSNTPGFVTGTRFLQSDVKIKLSGKAQAKVTQ